MLKKIKVYDLESILIAYKMYFWLFWVFEEAKKIIKINFKHKKNIVEYLW